MRAFLIGLLAAGLFQAPASTSPHRPQAAAHSQSQPAQPKAEKQFSYLSINLGVRFSYPSEYRLAPSPTPQGLSEADYHWMPVAAPHGSGASRPSYQHRYSVRMVNFDFATTASVVGYSLKSGKWTHPEIRRGHFESVKSIQGNGWKGLVAIFRGQLYSTSGKGLGMAEGTTIIAGNDETASIILNFFPARGTAELRKSILASLKFFSPKPIDTSVTRLFRDEKLGAEFRYPAAYTLSATKPFSPPGAASDSLPVEAAYELKLPLPPCCAGVGGLPFSVQYYIFFLKLDFLSAAKGLGFRKNPQGEWTYKDVGEVQKAERLSGDGWEGLRMTYNYRLYPAASAWQQTQGFTSGSGYLGASEGEKTVIGDGGNRSVVLEFDPDWESDSDVKKTYDTILKSLRFFAPMPSTTTRK